MSLSLNAVAIPSDGYVIASDIGAGSTGLLCNTDKSDCCRAADNPPSGPAQGQWYLPDGTQVESYSTLDTGIPRNFFYRNRDTGVVRLNRQGNPSERGRFRCEIPSTSGVMVDLYVNIGE